MWIRAPGSADGDRLLDERLFLELLADEGNKLETGNSKRCRCGVEEEDPLEFVKEVSL
jgi:hypothetical protein